MCLIRRIGVIVAIAATAGCSLNSKSSSGDSRPNAPELRIDRPMQMTSTTSTHLMFSILNWGLQPADGVSYKVTRDDGNVIKTASIGNLAPGAASDQSVVDQTVGHTYTVTVDPDNRVTEAVEENNSTTITSVETPVTPISGDLRFIDAHHHGAYYYQDPIFHFFIENTTSADITDVWYTIRQDGVDVFGFPKKIDRISPGTPAEVFQNPYGGANDKPSGHHTYTVVIDPANLLGESNEGNNSNRSEINVPLTYGYWPSGGKADLQFQDPHYHGPQEGRTIVFHGWIKNEHSSISTPASHFTILRNGAPVTIPAPGPGNIGYTLDGSGKPMVQALAPGQIVEYVVRIQESESGDIPYSLIIDSDGEVDEQYESSSANSWENNNRANWIVVMNPQGTAG
jgi:hypothetical protein